MPSWTLTKIDWMSGGTSVARAATVAAALKSVPRTSSRPTLTLSNVTEPLAVSRCPTFSQSSLAISPFQSAGRSRSELSRRA